MKCEWNPSGHVVLIPETEAEKAWIQFASGFNFLSFYREYFPGEEGCAETPESMALMIEKRKQPALVMRLEDE